MPASRSENVEIRSPQREAVRILSAFLGEKQSGKELAAGGVWTAIREKRKEDPMIIPVREKSVLRDLIGKKAEAVIVPAPASEVTEPANVYLKLSRNSAILLESALRPQSPTETFIHYPQLRLKQQNALPEFKHEQSMQLGRDGEIVRRIIIVNEDYRKNGKFASFTKAIHFDFSGRKEVTFIRSSIATPGLIITTEPEWKERLKECTPHDGCLHYETL